MTEQRPTLHLRAWRKFRGLTQAELAEAMGATTSIVSRLETGDRRWNETHIVQAAKALGCAPSDLLLIDPFKPPPLASLWDQVPQDKRAEFERAVRALAQAFRDPDPD